MTTARSVSIFGATLAMLLMAMPASAQTTLASVLADVPTGTYTLNFIKDPAAPADSPSPTTVNFVLAADGRLCTDDLSLIGAQLRTAPDLAVEWRNDLANSRFYLRVNDNDPDPAVENFVFQDIQFLSATNVLFGVFSLGTYNSSIGSCGAGNDPTLAQIETLLNSAETAFPALFPSGSFTFTQRSGIYTYRYYDSTSIYLAVSGGQVFARGGGYGSAYQSVGSFIDLNSNINNIVRPASVRDFFVGTYRTEMSDTQPFSTIPDGAVYTYAITASGQLCLNTTRILSNPVFLSNNTNIAVWRDDSAGISFRLQLNADDLGEELDAAEGILQVHSTSGQRFGELSGERISLDAICPIINPTHPDTLIMDQIERLFELAEQLYPEYIPLGPTVSTQRTADYTFRYYSVTDVFIAVRNGLVYSGSGMPTFSQPAQGTLNEVFIMLGQSTRDFLPASTLVGTYDVLVSNANPFFEFKNNARIRLVIAASGALCIDNITLNNPTSMRTSSSDVSWTNIQAGLNASMKLGGAANTVTMALTSNRGENLATLQGNRVNLMATCPLPVLSATEIASASELFLLAERRYPDLFDLTLGSSTRSTGGALTRFYPATNISISVSLNEVFVRGGDFGITDYFVGSVGNLIRDLSQQSAFTPYSVRVTGTATVIIAGMSAINRGINIIKTNQYNQTELTDNALPTLAATLLAGEIQTPDSIVIRNVVRSGGTLSFSAELIKTTVVGSSTSRRSINATFNLQAQ